MPSLIERKRDGQPLPADAWREIVERYTAGTLPDYQVSALLMAVVFRGLEEFELVALADAMQASGATLDWAGDGRPVVDKHSTGGVGDKTSLVLAPLLAAAGALVPMVSGRGLGHTGGTLDKLESIPGFRTDLPLDRATRIVRAVGAVMIGQTAELCPADRRLYALRDVTGTVPAIPLISASIMAKKLAEGLDALVLDVKAGSGAFLPDEAQALALARTMIGLGARRGVRTTALVTAMDRPLGVACGNALEVREALALLRGEPVPAELRTVSEALAVELLVEAGLAPDAAAARARVSGLLSGGHALEAFRRIVAAQGGDPRVCDVPDAVLPRAPVVHTVAAEAEGTVAEVAPVAVGRAVIGLGGGRLRVEDAVDPAVGIEVHVRPGDAIRPGDRLATVHARDAAGASAAAGAVRAAVRCGGPVVRRPLVSHRVTAAGVAAPA